MRAASKLANKQTTQQTANTVGPGLAVGPFCEINVQIHIQRADALAHAIHRNLEATSAGSLQSSSPEQQKQNETSVAILGALQEGSSGPKNYAILSHM